MNIGQIIKLNRIKKGITQGELCKEICSITHLSKIESGTTNVTSDVIELICKRLSISIEEETHQYEYSEELLEEFYNSIVYLDTPTATTLIDKLEDMDDYIQFTPLKFKVLLYKLRYLLMMNLKKEAKDLAEFLEENQKLLEESDFNSLIYCLGVYYTWSGDSVKSLTYLNKLDNLIDKDGDYSYYLSLAYYHNKSYINSYHYIIIALDLFRYNNNFKRIIDAEMLLALLLSSGERIGIEQSLDKFQKLLLLLRDMDDSERKSKIYHNIGYNYLLLKDYQQAANYYRMSMQLKDKNSYIYLTSLYSYIHCSFKLKNHIDDCNTLKKFILDGIIISKQIKEKKYYLLFNILLMKYNQDDQLYDYIYEEALPFFTKNNCISEAKEYGKLAFNHFQNKKSYQKSTEIASSILK
ncbi:TPA: helix-turn-helix domain-containing protein [Bacillus paranthracis]